MTTEGAKVGDEKDLRVTVTAGGPYVVSHGIPVVRETIIVDADGESVEWERGESCADGDACSLCRCGQSERKPFCDGSHIDAVWDGTETASRETYEEQMEVIEGPALHLTDVRPLCAEARFCHRDGGAWNLVHSSDDPKIADTVVDECEKCPSGRYVAVDAEQGVAHEPEFEPEIGVVEDPHASVSGPLWLRGGVPVESADGYTYEVRNRVTLCRCGQSRNKPFCDGSHVATGFREEH